MLLWGNSARIVGHEVTALDEIAWEDESETLLWLNWNKSWRILIKLRLLIKWNDFNNLGSKNKRFRGRPLNWGAERHLILLTSFKKMLHTKKKENLFNRLVFSVALNHQINSSLEIDKRGAKHSEVQMSLLVLIRKEIRRAMNWGNYHSVRWSGDEYLSIWVINIINVCSNCISVVWQGRF